MRAGIIIACLLVAVLVPMLMALGYSPELVRAAYRIGDSITNIVTALGIPLGPGAPLTYPGG